MVFQLLKRKLGKPFFHTISSLSTEQDDFDIDLANPGFRPGPKVIKLLSCSTQLSMKFFLLINVEMPTIVGRKNSILGSSEPEKCLIL